MKIGLFGGAFDPPTLAHKAIVEKILDKKICDVVMVVPAFTHRFAKQMSPFWDRYSMCKKLFQGMKVNVSSLEMDIPEIGGRLYHTARIVKERYHPNDNVMVIIGRDNAEQIDQFYNGKELVKENNFVVVDRGGSKYIYNDVEWLRETDIIMEIDTPENTSSTKVRENIRELKQMISNDTLEFILRNGLYVNN